MKWWCKWYGITMNAVMNFVLENVFMNEKPYQSLMNCCATLCFTTSLYTNWMKYPDTSWLRAAAHQHNGVEVLYSEIEVMI